MSLSLFVPLEHLVNKEHPYRRFIKLLDFEELTKPLKELENTEVGRHGYAISRGFRMLLLQYLEDLSDRELERYLQENLAAKLFCDFSLESHTPDFSYFSKLRSKIGTNRLAKLFNQVRDALKRQGLIREIFTFVDSSQLISKLSVWEERDKAIKAGLEKFNNVTAPKVCKDHQARLGCKGKNKFWLGYKRHVSVDMQSGLINKTAITPANTSDAKGLSHICPHQGAVFADKAYCLKSARRTLQREFGISGASEKANLVMK
jgi:transposase, IS5 family